MKKSCAPETTFSSCTGMDLPSSAEWNTWTSISPLVSSFTRLAKKSMAMPWSDVAG